MARPHIIESVVFDIRFNALKPALEQQALLANVCKDGLMEVIEDVFDTFSLPGQVVKIDHLDLDLGKVPYDNYRETLCRRLREQLTAELKSPHSELGDNIRVISTQQDELERLSYFLINGRLPRRGDITRPNTLAHLMRRVLRDNPKALVAFLYNAPHRESTARRLANQFSDELLIDVIGCLAPATAHLLGALLDRLAIALNPGNRAVMWRQSLWATLIAALLAEPRRSGNANAVAKILIAAAAKQCNLTPAALLSTLSTHLARQRGQEPLNQSLVELVHELERGQSPVEHNHTLRSIATLRRSWADALTAGRIIDIVQLWPAISQHPQITAEVLRRHAERADIRATLAMDAPEYVLENIVTALEPDESQFITDIVRHSELFRSVNKVDGSGGQRVKRQWWSLTLDYLLVERGSEFNKKSYLESLLRHDAAHDNMRYSDFLNSLSQVLERVELSSPLKRQLLELLSELAEHATPAQRHPAREDSDDASLALARALHAQLSSSKRYGNSSADQPLNQALKALDANNTTELLAFYRDYVAGKFTIGSHEEHNDATAESNQTNHALIRAHDVYDALSARLHGQAIAHSPQQIEEFITELHTIYPRQLLKLYRALQAAQTTQNNLGKGLSTEALRRLVNAIATLLDKRNVSAEPTEFQIAIDIYAKQCANTQHYYRQVLHRLVANQWVDFETIVQTSNDDAPPRTKDGSTQATTSLTSTAETFEDIAVALTPTDAITTLSTLFSADSPQSPQQDNAITHALDLMAQQQPRWLARLLSTLPDSVDVLMQLAAKLPERALTRIALLLRPQCGRFITIADIVSTALYGSALGITPTLAVRLKWQYLLNRAPNDTEAKSDAAFTRDFVNYVIGKLDHGDRPAFIAQLSQQLLLDAIPTTADLHRRLVSALSHPSTHASMLPDDKPTTPPAAPRRPPSKETSPQFTEAEPLHNAGIVLLTPYLPRLFGMLDLMNESVLRDERAAERAAHILQYLVDERTDTPEYELVLNKILCGLPIAWPIVKQIELSAEHKSTAESLLTGVIDNWAAIGQTSVAGLRESFLQREGHIQFKQDAWHLTIMPRTYDMLLDRLPWGFSPIKHPWMQHVVHVSWR